MIITLTLNPAVDQTVWVQRLAMGAVNRLRESQLDPAGKGINVSRMVYRLNWPTIAFTLLAGEVGAIVERALEGEGVVHHYVSVAGQTRINVTVVEEESGTATSFYAAGPEVGPEHLAQIEDLLTFWLQAGLVLVLAGSVPPGCPPDIYARYIRLADTKGVKTVLDADREPFRLGVEARPYLIKPNVAEAERLLGRPLPDLTAVIQAALELVSWGIQVVVISMGPDGAVCAQGDKVWHAIPPKVVRKSTVGSGDSMVAGLAVALARGVDIVEGLRLGTAAGAATAMTPGTALGSREEVAQLLPRVTIRQVTAKRARQSP